MSRELREAWHINYAPGKKRGVEGEGRTDSGRGKRQIESNQMCVSGVWAGVGDHKSSSLKKLNNICIKLKNKTKEKAAQSNLWWAKSYPVRE